MDIERLSVGAILNIMENLDYDSLMRLCESNKKIHGICMQFRSILSTAYIMKLYSIPNEPRYRDEIKLLLKLKILDIYRYDFTSREHYLRMMINNVKFWENRHKFPNLIQFPYKVAYPDIKVVLSVLRYDNFHLDNNYISRYFSKVGNLEMIIYLDGKGVLDNIKAMDEATFRKKWNIVEYLVNKGNIPQKYLDHALEDATKDQNAYMVRFLLEHGANVHYDNDVCFKDTIYNLPRGSVEIMEILLLHGANVHIDDDEAFIQACWRYDYKKISLLLKYGANIHARNDGAFTAAIIHRQRYILEFLFDLGVKPTYDMLKDAVKYDNLRAYQILLQKGGKSDIELLNLAVKMGHIDMASLIMKNGIKPTADTLQMSKTNDMRQLLIRFGARSGT